MAGPTDGERRVPPYVALVRIGAVVGMSLFAAFGLFMLVGGWWVFGVVSLLLATPFFFVMRLVENLAERSDDDEEEANEP